MAAAPFRFAPVTLGRATDFFGLLADLGAADVLSQVARARQARLPGGRPVGIAELAEAQAGDAGVLGVEVLVDLGPVFQAVVGGALLRCARIILVTDEGRVLSEEQARGVDDELFERAWFFFATRSLALYNRLAASVGDLA